MNLNRIDLIQEAILERVRYGYSMTSLTEIKLEEYRQQIIKNCKENGIYCDTEKMQFDLIGYSEFYCNHDVLLLAKGIYVLRMALLE